MVNERMILLYVDRKEIEETKDGHKETIEELIELKKKLTSSSIHSIVIS